VRKVRLEDGFTAADAVSLIGVSSIASAEAMLQAAVNRAVARRQTPVIVRRDDFEVAVRLVVGVEQVVRARGHLLR